MNTDQLQYENSNTKNLINEVYRINPNIKFTTFGNVISEKEAMMLYRAVLKNSHNKNTNLVYIPVLSM
jgi:aspartyl/asparaginyl-tRNA synthetase